jgi:glycosyltransferase involved in cell wall biosynthesis
VIAPRNPHTALYDPALLQQVPPQTRVHRVFDPGVPYLLRDRLWKNVSRSAGGASGADSGIVRACKRLVKEAAQRFFSPDVQKFWVPFVLRRARRVIRQESIQAVILTAPPFSLLGLVPPLKREFPHLTWITEIRDDWLGYSLPLFDSARTGAKQRLAIRMEGAAVRASDFVVAVTLAQRDAMKARYPDQPESKFLFVPNGFDGDLYAGFRPSREGRGNLVITYYGTVYASRPYDISRFLDALDSLPEELRARVELRFIGRIALDAQRQLENRTFKIVKMGFFPRAEGVRLLQDTDYLLVPANDPTTHAGKLFDGLATGLPTLALSPPGGEVARLLAETGGGVAVNGTDVPAIRNVLLDAFHRLDGQPHRFPTPNREAIAFYERRNLVARLVTLTGLDKD